jgi:GAF domain-containing protein
MESQGTNTTQPVNCGLEAVIATSELDRRPNLTPDFQAESRELSILSAALAEAPHDFFQLLVNAAMKLSWADSAGISLLDEKSRRFIWPAVAGGLYPYLGGGTPQDFGPCGTVLERNTPILFIHPERHFTYLEPIQPPLEEVLLIPFNIDGKTVGTLWAVMHRTERKFTSEDRRLLVELSGFASAAYKVLAELGAIEPLLGPHRQAPA